MNKINSLNQTKIRSNTTLHKHFKHLLQKCNKSKK
jgi:hypothetical protein